MNAKGQNGHNFHHVFTHFFSSFFSVVYVFDYESIIAYEALTKLVSVRYLMKLCVNDFICFINKSKLNGIQFGHWQTKLNPMAFSLGQAKLN